MRDWTATCPPHTKALPCKPPHQPCVQAGCPPILQMREDGWLPGAMELTTGSLWKTVMGRMRTQNFIGIAVTDPRDCSQGFLVFSFCSLCPRVGPPNE